jgi:hypothetical protein
LEDRSKTDRSGGVFTQEREAVQKSASNWGLDGVPIVSDPDNVLAREMGLVVSMTPVRPGIQCYFDTYKTGVCAVGPATQVVPLAHLLFVSTKRGLSREERFIP